MIRQAVHLCAALVLALTVWSAGPALAVEPDEILSDPRQEERARALSKKLRCLVCRNESIDESNADLARDLRLLVRERIEAGDTDEEVMALVRDRYGDFVLLSPPVQSNTMALWLAPLFVFGAGFALLIFYFRKNRLTADDLDSDDGEETPAAR